MEILFVVIKALLLLLLTETVFVQAYLIYELIKFWIRKTKSGE